MMSKSDVLLNSNLLSGVYFPSSPKQKGKKETWSQVNLTQIVTYHQKDFVILCTEEVFIVSHVAREVVFSWVTLSNREF